MKVSILRDWSTWVALSVPVAVALFVARSLLHWPNPVEPLRDAGPPNIVWRNPVTRFRAEIPPGWVALPQNDQLAVFLDPGGHGRVDLAVETESEPQPAGALPHLLNRYLDDFERARALPKTGIVAFGSAEEMRPVPPGAYAMRTYPVLKDSKGTCLNVSVQAWSFDRKTIWRSTVIAPCADARAREINFVLGSVQNTTRPH